MITLPVFTFSVTALAEAWGYDGEGRGMIGGGCVGLVADRRRASTSSRTASGQGGRAKSMGVLEEANTTHISGETVTGKKAKWDIKV